MSIIYNVITGDTFSLIARKKYGSETEAGRIARANPGVYEPLAPGTVIVIPDLQNTPIKTVQKADAVDPDEIALLIDGKRFRFWDSLKITSAIDSFSVVEFGAPFDFNIPGFKEVFKPFSYKSVIVTIGGDPVFTGVMVAVNPVIETEQKTITVSCYSLPGVLNDCNPPASSAESLEFNNLKLTDIARALCEPFGINAKFIDDSGATFELVACEADKTIFSFLSDLAKQRNLIITDDERGNLVFHKSIARGNPVARFTSGDNGPLMITPAFNPQEYYSHVTGMQDVSIGDSGSQYTVKNTKLNGIIRPLTFTIPDTATADIKTTVNAKIGRMFGNMVSYSVRIPSWRDPGGGLWKPNTSITLFAPDAMIYRDYDFIIRSIVFERDTSTKTATLNLVMPGSFSGEIPEFLPWE